MYELKKMERYLGVNLLGPGPRLTKKRIYRAAVSQKLRNSGLNHSWHESDHSRPSSKEMKNKWNCTSIPPPVCLRGLNRDNFVF